jgi:ATP-dependent protease ClpP protease subunit
MENNFSKPLFISFSAEVDQNAAENLMGIFAQRLNQGTKDFYLLLSSPGGNVMNGVTIYNFLKSLPINLTTHNIGIVDSIANVIFLAGETRYAVKNSSFLFHGVGFNVNQARFEEKNIKEQLKTIQRDQKLIADIIAEQSRYTKDEIEKMFLEADTKTPEQVKEKGLISDIRDVNIPEGAEVIQFVFQRK